MCRRWKAFPKAEFLIAMSNERDSKSSYFDWFLVDRLDAVWWGLVFILGALVLLAENAGWAATWSWWEGWGVFFTGAGILALLAAVIRLQMPAYRAKWVFSAVFGVIFTAIGLGAWDTAWWVWVIVLLVVGAVILQSAFTRPP